MKNKDLDRALIIFYDEIGRILLQNRKSISKEGEEWGFFGGGIEEGETPEEAVIRETKEGLNYDLDEFELAFDETSILPNGKSKHYHIFISPLKDKMSKFELKEGDAMKLFDIEEAKELKISNEDKRFLDIIAERLRVMK